MGHHKDNDELRGENQDREERRQERRDETFEETDGGVADLGSQDEGRAEHDRDR